MRIDQLPKLYQQQAMDRIGQQTAISRPRKYRNEPVTVGGEKFDSRLEAKTCAALRLAHPAVFRQVSVPVGKLRMRLDFLIVHEVLEDGRFVGEFADAKGMITEGWAAKRNHFEDVYRGLKIRLIGKGNSKL